MTNTTSQDSIMQAPATRSREKLGLLLGLCGVAGFSATLPATRLAVAYLDPTLVGLGRSLVAGILAATLLWLTRQPLPSRVQTKSLAVAAAGVIVGFPLLSSWAMQSLPAAHGAILVAILPLFTAIAGALRTGERPSAGFWLASLAGSILVAAFAVFSGAGGWQSADGLLMLASLAAAVGYAEGGRLARTMGGWQVICWALVITAPFLLLPVALAFLRHGAEAPLQAWLGFGYVSVVSQLIAFVLWYQGLALGGVVRVSQIQLLQPFMTLGVAALLLRESVTPAMIVFALAVAATVAVGRHMPIAGAESSSRGKN
jgi:drug/metabolite transporter (DMT)-like permease